nr:aldo/keto reductase [Fournierella massiliensis]
MEFITENGRAVSRIGQGTWYLGENAATAARERKALQAGVEAGMNLIDTAEMYGEGASEHLIGSAIRGMDRASLYLVSKVYPFHADRRSIFLSCENSLRRLGTDYLDLYLLHWRGAVPLAETVECMEQLKAKGRIRAWGVSNFDALDMDELMGVTGGSRCATDQVLYHLGSRGVEFDLLPWMQKQGMPMMAYCPLAQAGSLRRDLAGCAAVQNAAAAHGVSPWQVLLSFLLTRPGVYPIPRSSLAEHTLDNAAALELRLSAEELAALDAAFPAPTRRTPLDIV